MTYNFVRTEPFNRDYRKLPPAAQDDVDRTLRKLANNPWPAGLGVKKMQPHSRGIWEARVNLHSRLTFEFDKKDGSVIVLRRVGTTHSILSTP
jgi:mRNA-degrading endonuclease RelE of RelBE toxin-antitoxin system